MPIRASLFRRADVRPRVVAALAAFAAAPLLAAPGEAPRDTVCRAVSGMLVPACNAAVCNQGTLTGDLRGRFTARVTSIYPSGSGWLYTSWMQLELADGAGRIDTLDDGIAPRDARGGPDLARATEVVRFETASGAYAEHTGTLVLVGAHALGEKTAYVGRVCRHGVSTTAP